MPYLAIENYGLIGNMRSAALVGKNGSIDWLCLPRFDSPSLFGAVLDDDVGGHFQIAPAHPETVTQKQLYWPGTNVLITRFLSEEGVAQVVDYMPLCEGGTRPEGAPDLVRRVEVVRGEIPLWAVCRPAFDYARADHETILNQEIGASFDADGATLHLRVASGEKSVGLEEVARGGVEATLRLGEGQRAAFALYYDGSDRAPSSFGMAHEQRLLDDTLDYWRSWLSGCAYAGRWREQVYRSALALKLMTHRPTGAIVAAPTCSLPEQIGGERNWDYRYTWIRDAAFTVYAFLRLGFTEEAGAFIEWLKERCGNGSSTPAQPLQIVHGIGGETDLTEETLDHLDGYRGSSPVRIGNSASGQLQLDIYGELFDAVYLSNKYRAPISYDFWTRLRSYADWVAENWQKKDNGIWEMRGENRQFVYSKLMCWVALDRALRLAEKRSFPAPRERWADARDAIYAEIMDAGWSEEREAFVMHYGADALDASSLMMPLVFFMSPSDPRMIKTLDAISQAPDEGGLLFDSLVYRYNPEHVDDGVSGEHEGTFNMCSFWLVEALTRAGRTDPEKLRRARLIFETMLGYASPLGLYAEETGARGEALGNFPQAFTHLAMISAAFNLDRTLDGERYGKLG